jgi:uncharacterized protein (UPF0333 family)
MSKKPTERKSGQIMLEYTVVAAMMLAIIGILTLFMYVFKEHGARVMDLVASEYP